MSNVRARLARLTEDHGYGEPSPCLQVEESDGTRRPTDDELAAKMGRLRAEGFAPYVHRVTVETAEPPMPGSLRARLRCVERAADAQPEADPYPFLSLPRGEDGRPYAVAPPDSPIPPEERRRWAGDLERIVARQ